MNLTELKQKTVPELLDIAREMGIDNLARSRKQDIIFAIPINIKQCNKMKARVRETFRYM